MLMAGMDVGGFLMAEHSDLEHFQVFIYAFAAPFAAFAAGCGFNRSGAGCMVAMGKRARWALA